MIVFETEFFGGDFFLLFFLLVVGPHELIGRIQMGFTLIENVSKTVSEKC